jgi:hypothetical protein
MSSLKRKRKQKQQSSKASRNISIHEALQLLKKIHAIDSDCLEKLVRLRVCANYTLEREPWMVTHTHSENYDAKVIGVVEILNTLFASGDEIIVPVFDVAGSRLLTFVLAKRGSEEDAVPQHKARRR